MSVIVLKVAKDWTRWAVFHEDQPIARFDTQEEAERAALALAIHHPKRDVADVELPNRDGDQGRIKVY